MKKTTHKYKVGDRVRVIATRSEVIAFGVPGSFFDDLVDGFAFVRSVDKEGDYSLAARVEPNPLFWWFKPNMFEPAPLPKHTPPLPKHTTTIFVTERLKTAQDLLHQLDSIRQQASLLTGMSFSLCNLHNALDHVMAEEIEAQTKPK